MSRIPEASPLTLAEQWLALEHAAAVYAAGHGDRRNTALYLQHRANELLLAMSLGASQREALIAIRDGSFRRWMLDFVDDVVVMGLAEQTGAGSFRVTEAGEMYLARLRRAA